MELRGALHGHVCSNPHGRAVDGPIRRRWLISNEQSSLVLINIAFRLSYPTPFLIDRAVMVSVGSKWETPAQNISQSSAQIVAFL